MGYTLAYKKTGTYDFQYAISFDPENEELSALGINGDYVVVGEYNNYPVLSNGRYILVYINQEYIDPNTGETIQPGYQIYENTPDFEGELEPWETI